MFDANLPNIMAQRVGSARSPEEAAQLFHELITEHICDAIAKGLAEVKGKAAKINLNNTTTDGWLDYVRGCSIALEWPTPHGQPVQIGLPVMRTAQISPPDGVAINSVDVTVGLSVRF